MTNRRSRVRRRRWLRRIATAFLAFHVVAIIVAPASVEPTSQFWLRCWAPVRPYVQLVFLDQGWNFFAPEPGPSTLISFRGETESGELVEQRIPNKKIWPRLFYHRHFMVTSYMGYQPEDVQEVLCEGFIAHLESKHGIEDVEFSKWVHLLPSQQHIRDGGNLNHADLWEEHVFVEEDPNGSNMETTGIDQTEYELGQTDTEEKATADTQ